MPADVPQISVLRGSLVHDASFAHYQDAIAEREDFVQIGTDQEHGGAPVARVHQLGADVRDRPEIEAEAGVGGNQDGYFAG